MRLRHSLLVTGLILGITSLHGPGAHAADSTAQQPNLGLSPTAQPAKPDEPDDKNDTQAIQQPAPARNLPAAKPAKASVAAKPNNVKITPGGVLAKDAGMTEEQRVNELVTTALLGKGVTVQPAKPSPQVEKVRAWAEQERKKRFSSPVNYFEDSDDYVPAQSYLDGLANSMSVAVNESYIWGREDVTAIKQYIGWDAAQVPAHCQVRLDTQLMSPDGFYHSRIFSGQKTAIKYSGAINAVKIQPWGVCDIPSGDAPQNGGLVGKVGGDKYSTSLGTDGTCPLPPKGATTLEIAYKGAGKADCVYK